MTATRTGMKRLNKERQTLAAAAAILRQRNRPDTAATVEMVMMRVSLEHDAMHREVWAKEEAQRQENR